MGLFLAFKTFFKAFKDPAGAQAFCQGPQKELTHKEDPSHLRLLNLLQKEGRLIDFLKEDISPFSDAQIGAAVRKIHHDSGLCVEEFVTLRPIFNESEGTEVTIPSGYDPSTVKITGKVKGSPPYIGVLRHKGWKAHKLSLPKSAVEGDRSIICPAEVEVKG